MAKKSSSGIEYLNPPSVPAPAARYSQGVTAPAGARFLYISGQIGAAVDGTVPTDFAAQAQNVWRNLLGVLEAAGMTAENLIKTTAFLTRPSDLGTYRTVRATVAGEVRPASTLVFVAALADPRLLIEVEAIAAKA
jgi:enamine deaminase RidA (YjgF/YER057c/UK114 family)